LIADDHSGPVLGHLGDRNARTPYLDALAAHGTSFASHHCQGSMQGAVCVPSRASLMTGRSIFDSSEDPTARDYPRSLVIPEPLPTFPQLLRAAGYHTHGIGKWHNDIASFNRSFASGDTIMFGGMSDHWAVPIRPYDPTGAYPDDAVTTGEGFSTDLFADAAIRFIGNAKPDDPFLLYTAFTAPHDPRTPPPGWTIDPASIELPPNVLPMHPFDNGWLNGRDENLASHPRGRDEVRQHLGDYHGMIWHLDAAVGRIMTALEERGLADDTVVIYTADHGLAVGQHGLMGKQNCYQHSLRVPLVLAGPGIPHGEIGTGLTWHADTTATILALAGVDANPIACGRPIFTDGAISPGRDLLGAGFGWGQRSVRDARYKLIRYTLLTDDTSHDEDTRGSDVLQLFDLDNDPWEMANLAGMPEHRETIDRLLAALAAWQAEAHDPLLEA
jgi:arylsulfatase A-like enzyme